MGKYGKKEIITLFLPSLHGGGAERSMVTLANGLVEKGYQVHLLLAKAEGVYFAEISEGVQVLSLQARRTILSFSALVKYLHTVTPYAMISALENANLSAIWSKVLCGLPEKLIITERSVNTILYRNHPRLELRLIPYLTRLFYRYADQVIAVSHGVAQDLEKNGVPKEKITTIYNPVDIDKVKRLSQEPVTHHWFVPKRYPIILSAGRLSREKNFVFLLEAFHNILERKEARLVILGEGEERQQLERKIKQLGLEGKVDLPGFDPNPFKYMCQADVFVLPSRVEGLPGVLIQAMALGTPVVATDSPGGSSEILENGKWGVLVPLDDVAAMAQAIERGLRGELPDPTPRGMDFAVEKIVDQYLRLLALE
jgi:glycosyltransferase involved in cell wall biosynthesis